MNMHLAPITSTPKGSIVAWLERGGCSLFSTLAGKLFFLIGDISRSAFVAQVSVSDDKSRLFFPAALEWVCGPARRFLSDRGDIKGSFYNIKVTFAEAARPSAHYEVSNKALYSENHNTGSHICVALLIFETFCRPC